MSNILFAREIYRKARMSYARRRWGAADRQIASMFDTGYYLRTYPDVRRSGIDPFEHFMTIGWKEKRNPSSGFDTVFYLKEYKDVEAAGMNPLVHYIKYGMREGRLPNPAALKRILKRVPNRGELGHQFDIDVFLSQSLVQPVLLAPFKEPQKRILAMMENIRKDMVRAALRMPDLPLVSIIMPSYNRVDIISMAIESVLKQSYPNFELIVSDDGSKDSTRDLVLSINDDRVRYIESSENTGSSAARNRALNIARGEFITFLDSDNKMHVDFVAGMVGAFLKNPDADMIYCAQLLYRERLGTPYGLRFGVFNPSLLENTNYIDLNCVMHRRSLTDQGLCFDEQLTRLVDWDYVLEIANRCAVVSAPMALSHYYLGVASNTITANGRYKEAMADVAAKNVKRVKSHMPSVSRLAEPISVIIPNFEAPDSLKECLESLSMNIHHDDYEVVIVDNGSTVGVRDFLREQSKGNTTVIQNEENYGFSHAINQGAAACSPGRPLLLLNNDAMIQGGAAQAMQRMARSSPDIGVVVPRQILLPGERTINTHVPAAYPNRECDVSLSLHHGNILAPNLFHDGTSVDLSFAPFFCVYVKRTTFEALGGLDAEFGRHYRSDRTFCSLTRKMLGQRVVYTPEARVIHMHQVATKALKASDKTAFDAMHSANQWPPEQASELGFARAEWDV